MAAISALVLVDMFIMKILINVKVKKVICFNLNTLEKKGYHLKHQYDIPQPLPQVLTLVKDRHKIYIGRSLILVGLPLRTKYFIKSLCYSDYTEKCFMLTCTVLIRSILQYITV